MKTGRKRDLRTVVIAALAAVLVLGGPAAAVLTNVDMVDGKHAVSAGASKTTRAGKLVATSSAGYLPNNIILKAGDANLLDGKDSTVFLLKTQRAANANLLDSLDSTDFWRKTDALNAATAAEADTLDGQHASAFLGATGTAVNADRLDELDSTDFWRKTDSVTAASAATASDADTLDGVHAAGFLPAGGTSADSDKVDGHHSSDFWLKTDNVNADLLDGRHATQVKSFAVSGAQGGPGPTLGSTATPWFSVNLTAPAPGWIIARAVVTLQADHVVGNPSGYKVTLSQSSTAHGDPSGQAFWTIPDAAATGVYTTSASPQTMIAVPSSGMFNVVLVGTGQSVRFNTAHITLTFIPS